MWFFDAVPSLTNPSIVSFPTSVVSYFMCREHIAREETMCLLHVLILTELTSIQGGVDGVDG